MGPSAATAAVRSAALRSMSPVAVESLLLQAARCPLSSPPTAHTQSPEWLMPLHSAVAAVGLRSCIVCRLIMLELPLPSYIAVQTQALLYCCTVHPPVQVVDDYGILSVSSMLPELQTGAVASGMQSSCPPRHCPLIPRGIYGVHLGVEEKRRMVHALLVTVSTFKSFPSWQHVSYFVKEVTRAKPREPLWEVSTMHSALVNPQ